MDLLGIKSKISSRYTIVLAIALVIVLVFVVIFKKPPPARTEGDRAAKDSSAFIAYKGMPYTPTTNANSNTLLRADLAYFARKSLPTIYDPNKHPGVLFVVTTPPSQSSDAFMLVGHFELSKDKITVTFTIGANDRIKDSIVDSKTQKNLNGELPSTNRFNTLIGKLPITKDNYAINYVVADGSIAVVITDPQPIYLNDAKTFIAYQLNVPVSDLTKYSIGYTFPTNLDEYRPVFED